MVSGFNVEYSRGGFASIFLAEYSRILRAILFLGGNIILLKFDLLKYKDLLQIEHQCKLIELQL